MTFGNNSTGVVLQTNLWNVCEALVTLFDPFAELVLHDLKTETITNITGGLTDREVGDPSFIDDLPFGQDVGPIFGPYRKTNPDGRTIKSISILLSDEAGAPMSLMCVNIDISRFDAAHALLSKFVEIPEQRIHNPLADDWLDTLNRFVADWRLDQGVSDKALSVSDRRRLLTALMDNGVFERPKAADAVARAIGISRATVYADLKALDPSRGP